MVLGDLLIDPHPPPENNRKCLLDIPSFLQRKYLEYVIPWSTKEKQGGKKPEEGGVINITNELGGFAS